MHEPSSLFLDRLGGTSEVSRLIRTPITTVHTWRKTGIPHSRLDHIMLAATARGKAEDLAIALPLLGAAGSEVGVDHPHAEPSAGETTAANSGKAEISAGEASHG